MSFLAPVWLGVAAAAALAVVAIHLIAWRQPRTVVLPTARFVPDEPALRAARTVRLADLALLALRVGVVVAGGVAMARPVIASRPGGSATVVALSSDIGDSLALADSLRAVPRGDHTAFVVYDTLARLTTGPDGLPGAQPAGESSLTAGLLAAIREARRLRSEFETVRLVVAAPFTRNEFDQATGAVRRLWPDSIRLIRMPPVGRTTIAARVEFAASGDDPVVAGIRLAQSNGVIRGTARVVREGQAAPPEPGQALVLWPRTPPNDSSRIDAVHAGNVTAIGPFTPAPLGDSGRVIARWVDGRAAAREVRLGGACIRTVGFDVPDLGDFVLTPSFQHLAAELLAPCASSGQSRPAPDSLIAALSPPATGSPLPVPPAADSRNRVAAILMAVAALLGVAELGLRRRHRLAEQPA